MNALTSRLFQPSGQLRNMYTRSTQIAPIMAPKVLVVLTSAGHMSKTPKLQWNVDQIKPTGWYLVRILHSMNCKIR